MIWRFRFDDDGEIVGLGGGTPFGPWDTDAEALGALQGEFGFNQAKDGCYVLVNESKDSPQHVALSTYTFIEDDVALAPYINCLRPQET